MNILNSFILRSQPFVFKNEPDREKLAGIKVLYAFLNANDAQTKRRKVRYDSCRNIIKPFFSLGLCVSASFAFMNFQNSV